MIFELNCSPHGLLMLVLQCDVKDVCLMRTMVNGVTPQVAMTSLSLRLPLGAMPVDTGIRAGEAPRSARMRPPLQRYCGSR